MTSRARDRLSTAASRDAIVTSPCAVVVLIITPFPSRAKLSAGFLLAHSAAVGRPDPLQVFGRSRSTFRCVVTNEMCSCYRKQADRKGAAVIAAARECDRIGVPMMHLNREHPYSLA
jgi:hypothetical protein